MAEIKIRNDEHTSMDEMKLKDSGRGVDVMAKKMLQLLLPLLALNLIGGIKIIFIEYSQNHMTVAFDENEQTAKDYSIQITL